MKYESTKEEVFGNIYRSYKKEIYHTVLMMVGDSELAYDLTHQAFVNFYKRMDEVEIHPECYKHYIMNAACNLAKNHFRSKGKEFSLDEIANDKRYHPNLVDESMEERYIREEQIEVKSKLTKEILADLKENNRGWYDMIQMMFFEEKDHDEIADELGITKEVLYSRLYRAKGFIRKKYKVRFEEIDE